MGMKWASRDRTICEVIRKINDEAQGSSETDWKIRHLCTEAEIMAKKMALKLIEYKREVTGVEFYKWENKNPTAEADLERRLSELYKIGQ